MHIHSVSWWYDDEYDCDVWLCDACDFTGTFSDALAHVVARQFVYHPSDILASDEGE